MKIAKPADNRTKEKQQIGSWVHRNFLLTLHSIRFQSDVAMPRTAVNAGHPGHPQKPISTRVIYNRLWMYGIIPDPIFWCHPPVLQVPALWFVSRSFLDGSQFILFHHDGRRRARRRRSSTFGTSWEDNPPLTKHQLNKPKDLQKFGTHSQAFSTGLSRLRGTESLFYLHGSPLVRHTRYLLFNNNYWVISKQTCHKLVFIAKLILNKSDIPP